MLNFIFFMLRAYCFPFLFCAFSFSAALLSFFELWIDKWHSSGFYDVAATAAPAAEPNFMMRVFRIYIHTFVHRSMYVCICVLRKRISAKMWVTRRMNFWSYAVFYAGFGFCVPHFIRLVSITNDWIKNVCHSAEGSFSFTISVLFL